MDESLYDRAAITPMAEELNAVAVRSLGTADEVDQAITKTDGTVLLVVNSVCGCAAGNCRPGVARALQHSKIPDEMVTVFAGVDRSATQRARELMKDVPPSSPCIALFKGGELTAMLERRHIEQMSEEMVAQALIKTFDEHCNREGPSIPKEDFEKLTSSRQCGSGVPPNPMMPRY